MGAQAWRDCTALPMTKIGKLMDATETPDEQRPAINPETKTALELCKLASELLETYSHDVALQILSTVVAHQIASRTSGLPAGTVVCANFNASMVDKVVFSFTVAQREAQMKAAEELQAEEGPPAGTRVN
jgi:hypothetical protein